MPPAEPVLIAAILLLAGVAAGKVSGRFGIPALLLFLLIGMLAGSDGPGGIAFEDAELSSSIGALALALILFAGGLDTRWSAVRPVIVPGVLLATIGTAITAAVAGIGAVLIFDVPLALGLLVGAIISSTDAAAVFSVLRSRGVGLKGSLRPLLELESASNDPMAVFLTLAFTAVVQSPETSGAELAVLMLQQVVVGGLGGIAGGWAAVKVINGIRLESEGLYPVLTMAIVLTIYSVVAVLGGSGFLAVYVAGVLIARRRVVHKRSLLRFHDAVSWLMQIVMFLVLGLLVFPSDLPVVALPGLALAVALMLVARPFAVMILLWRGWSFRDRLFVSWVGLRGATPIILATFPLAQGVEQADLIFDAVFFVVLLSVAMQGTTIPLVARLLGVEDSGAGSPADREEIVGGGVTGRSLTEIEVLPEAFAVDRAVFELDLPSRVWLALLIRGNEVLVPQGPTTIRAGDRLVVLASEHDRRRILKVLGEATPPSRSILRIRRPRRG